MGQSDSNNASLFYLREMTQEHCHKSAYMYAFLCSSANPIPALHLLWAKMISAGDLLSDLLDFTMKSVY